MIDHSGDRVSESVSSLMDEELSELELARTLKTLAETPGARQKWHRYHLAATAMRRELPREPIDLSDRISRAIAMQPELRATGRGWHRPLSKLAVAASVAAVAVLGALQLQPQLFQDGASTTAVAQQQAGADADANYVGPRFRQPSGIETPQVHFRTVSTGAASSNAFVQQNNPSRQQSLQEFVDKETHVQIQSYLNHLMRRHTEQAAMQTSHGTLLLARLPHSQDEQ